MYLRTRIFLILFTFHTSFLIGNEFGQSYGATLEEFEAPTDGIKKESVFDQLNPGHLKVPVLAAKPVKITMSGFVMNNLFWDTRQTFAFQASDSLLFPLAVVRDPQGNDINAHGNVNITSIETVLRFSLDGPYIGCAKTSGAIETNFFGLKDFSLNINDLTLLKAYMQLSWEHLDIVLGQDVHPIANPLGLPNVVGYSIGNPFNPYAYTPQMKLIYHFPKADIIFALISEMNTPGLGPVSFNVIDFSSEFFRNSMMPKIHGQLRVPFLNYYTFGIAYDAKRIVPRLETNDGFKSFESLFSSTGITYIEMKKDPWTGILKATMSQNGIDYGVVGGYAVHSVDPVTDRRTYTNFTVGALFMDIEYDANVYQPGFFAGVLKSMGADRSVIQEIPTPQGPETTLYSLGADIDVMFRFAPRLRYNIPPVQIAAEFEYTQARHGTILNSGKIVGGESAGNWRFLLAMYYFF